MTVSIQTPINSYTGNGSTKIYPYTFKILKSSDITVKVNDVLQSSGYTVSNVGNNSGGNITFTVAPANSSAIVIQRATALERNTDYINGGVLAADTLDNDIDSIVMMVQDLNQNSSNDFADLTNLPTTLSGYGITDAASSTHNHDSVYASLSHNHDGTYQVAGSYAAASHNHDATYQPLGSYAASSHTHTFASLTSKPTTLSGYGITDAASTSHNHDATYQPLGSYAAASHTHTFASLTSKPSTLSGYGITDAASSSHNHDASYATLSQLNTLQTTVNNAAYFDATFVLQSGSNNTFVISEYASFPFQILSARYITTSGTITASININGTPVGNLSALSISSTQNNATASSNYNVSVGGKVTVVTTSNSSAINTTITLNCKRI